MIRGLNQWRDDVHRLAVEKGWHEDRDISDPHVLGSMLALIHSEVSEALEDVRKGKLELMFQGTAGALAHSEMSGEELERYKALALKPVGLPSELADIIIRVLDMCGALGIDIEQAVTVKHAYNATRSHRHGGKKL